MWALSQEVWCPYRRQDWDIVRPREGPVRTGGESSTCRHIRQALHLCCISHPVCVSFFFSWWHPKFPNQGSNPYPLQQKCGVLTTGPPGKSPVGGILYVNPRKLTQWGKGSKRGGGGPGCAHIPPPRLSEAHFLHLWETQRRREHPLVPGRISCSK